MSDANHKVYRSSLIITLIVILGKMVGIVRDSLIAKSFGLTYMNDIYLFSIGTTMLFISFGYGLTTALIPVHSEIIHKESLEYRNDFANNIINISFVFSLILVILGIVFSDKIITTFVPSFANDPNMYAEARLLLRIMFLSFLFMGVQSSIAAINQCHKQFYEAASMSIFSNLIYIIYLAFFIGRYGLKGFGVATVLGFFSMLVVNIPKYRSLGYRYRVYIKFRDKNIKKILFLILPVIISSSLIQINLFTLRSFAGHLYYGAISSIDYANKVNMIVYEVFAVAINMVVYPTLSSFMSSNDLDGFRDSLYRGINLILLIMLPAAVGVFILRVPIITLYLKRGAFGEKEVLMTAEALVLYIPSMVAYGIRDLLCRVYYSFNDGRIVVINSILNILLGIVLCAVFINRMGVPGLALANSLAVILCDIFLFIRLKKHLNNIRFRELLISFSKISISAFIMGILVFALNSFLKGNHILTAANSTISILLCAFTGALCYFAAAFILKVKETKDILGNIFKKE